MSLNLYRYVTGETMISITTNEEAVDNNVRFVEIIRRMTKRIEAGNFESASKLGRVVWETAKASGIKVKDWDSRFDAG
jgi:hypothetical protein